MKVQYLEIVTPDVDAVCATYAKLYGVELQRTGGRAWERARRLVTQRRSARSPRADA